MHALWSFLTPLSSSAMVGMTLAAFALVLTPGPNMIYLVSRSISQGRNAGLVSLLGTGLGFVIYMLMANLGLAAIFVAVPWLFIAFKVVGVLYLARLAWESLRPGGKNMFEINQTPPVSRMRLFRMGLVTNLLNPKVAIMYLTLIPQFVDTTRDNTLAQGLALGSIQIVVSVSVNALIVLAAGSIAAFLATRPKWTTIQRRMTGTLLGAVTLMLAREVPAKARA